MKFAQDRILLAEDLLKGLSDRVVDKGEGYQRTRQAFGILLGQFGNGAPPGFQLCRRRIHAPRSSRRSQWPRPFVPVKGDKQREALKFLQEHILADETFQFPPEMLPSGVRSLVALGQRTGHHAIGRLSHPRTGVEHSASIV